MAENPAAFSEHASVARHRSPKRPMTAHDDNDDNDGNGKAEVLRKLQGSAYFEKILPRTSVGMEFVLTVPLWFVRTHGNKLGKSVILRSASSMQEWRVNIILHYGIAPQVRLSGGWRAFAICNKLSVGDSVIFSLKAISEFEVYVFRRIDEKSNRCLRTRSRTYSRERFAAAGKLEGSAQKRRVREELSVSASIPSASSCSLSLSDCSDVHLRQTVGRSPSISPSATDSSSDGHRKTRSKRESETDLDMASGYRDPVQHIGATLKRGFHGESAPARRIRNPQLPGFSTTLTMSNFFQGGERREEKSAANLEIPPRFWKKYSNQLRSIVKLQGIREESPIRTVQCSLTSQERTRHWRVYLRAGWSDFRDENNLQVGEELQFTLSADSYFVVRRVNS